MVKKRRKLLIMGAVALALALTAAACSNDNNGNNDPTASPGPSATSSPSSAPETDNPSASPEQSGPQTGVYVGQLDGHSIEITTDAGPVVYQVSPEFADKVSPWDKDTPVTYEYREEIIDNDGDEIKQLVITAIDKS